METREEGLGEPADSRQVLQCRLETARPDSRYKRIMQWWLPVSLFADADCPARVLASWEYSPELRALPQVLAIPLPCLLAHLLVRRSQYPGPAVNLARSCSQPGPVLQPTWSLSSVNPGPGLDADLEDPEALALTCNTGLLSLLQTHQAGFRLLSSLSCLLTLQRELCLRSV